MSNLAQLLQEDIHNKNIMEHIMNELVNKEYSIANDIKVSYSLINTAQKTLSDLDKSNLIDGKEALFLGVALSLDSFAIGISSGILGIHSLLFPLLVSIFQLVFICIGNFVGCLLNSFNKIPEYIWSMISGILLIIIGIIKLF